MSEHTPGPWFQFRKNNLCIESSDGNVALCNLARASDADARLIAAAPELLEALKDLLLKEKLDDDDPRLAYARERASLAITKATGAQS